MSEIPLYAEVEVVNVDPNETNLKVGDKGWVLGMSESKNRKYYAVTFSDPFDVFCIGEGSLKPTGVQKEHKDFYSGESIRVSVDEDGNGSVVS